MVVADCLNRNVAGTKIKIKHVLYALLSLALIVVIVFLILLIISTTASAASEETYIPNKLDELHGPVKYVNLLYRHGARNPDSLPPNDIYKSMDNWPEGFSELTEEGMMQHYNLGKWLAIRYKHLLPADQMKTNQALRVISTDWNRTIMSAQAQLTGMFPVNDPSSPLSQLKYRPVPIHVIPAKDDYLLLMSKKCDRYETLMKELTASTEFVDELNKYKETTNAVEEKYGTKVDPGNPMRTYLAIYGNIQIETGRGFPQPSWVTDIYPFPLEHLVNISVMAETWNLEMKRLRGGPFMKEILGNFNEKLNGLQGNRNLTMYSSHDTVIASILNTLNIYDYIPPPFASILLFELRHPSDGVPVVTISYKNSTDPPHTLVLPNCEEACPLSTMKTLLKPIIPDDWEKECQAASSATSPV